MFIGCIIELKSTGIKFMSQPLHALRVRCGGESVIAITTIVTLFTSRLPSMSEECRRKMILPKELFNSLWSLMWRTQNAIPQAHPSTPYYFQYENQRNVNGENAPRDVCENHKLADISCIRCLLWIWNTGDINVTIMRLNVEKVPLKTFGFSNTSLFLPSFREMLLGNHKNIKPFH